MERHNDGQVLEPLVEAEQALDGQAVSPPKAMSGVYRGMVSEIDVASRLIRIVIPSLFGMEPLAARSIVPLSKERIGEEVLVVFEAGAPHSPYIIGSLWQPEQAPAVSQSPIQAKVDGEQVVIEGKKEIVLKCGKASITLTRAGKVLIRGAYVLSRSSGVNRIKGGSVQLN